MKDDEFYTPKSVIDYFGGDFDYDPSTNKAKAKEFGIKEFDTIETDGLKADWSKYKKIWINPPFTRKFDFIKKATETYKQNPYIYIYTHTNTKHLHKKVYRCDWRSWVQIVFA